MVLCHCRCFKYSFIFIASAWILSTVSIVHAQADRPDDETCLACHDEYDQTLSNTVHQLQSSMKSPATSVSCVSCHTGAAEHVEDPSVDNIGNPARLRGDDAVRVCTRCHVAHDALDNFGFDVHNELELNCASCHRVHGGNGEKLLTDKPDFCLKCHRAVGNTFNRQSQHPLRQGAVTCLSCHKFTRRRDNNEAYEFNRICEDCHPEQTGPFPYEHPAANAYMVEGPGCLECHEPHSSQNDRLLKQPGEQLCLQCHVKPPGHQNMPALHGFVADIKTCYACHNDVHGSFVSSRFLDPMLQARLGSPRDCTQCHDLTN